MPDLDTLLADFELKLEAAANLANTAASKLAESNAAAEASSLANQERESARSTLIAAIQAA